MQSVLLTFEQKIGRGLARGILLYQGFFYILETTNRIMINCESVVLQQPVESIVRWLMNWT